MKLPPTHPAEDTALYQTTLTVRQCARDRTRTHTQAPPLAPGRSDTGAGPIRGQTPDQICKGKKHQRPPRRATSARSCPTPKLTVSVSLDRKEQPFRSGRGRGVASVPEHIDGNSISEGGLDGARQSQIAPASISGACFDSVTRKIFKLSYLALRPLCA